MVQFKLLHDSVINSAKHNKSLYHINYLGRYARVLDHLAVKKKKVAQITPHGGGSTLHPPPLSYCTLCSLREPVDRKHLGQCTALFNGTECERYWETGTKMMGKQTWILFY